MIKYLFDRSMALIGLICLWPVLLVVAILIKVKMPGGPVLFDLLVKTGAETPQKQENATL